MPRTAFFTLPLFVSMAVVAFALMGPRPAAAQMSAPTVADTPGWRPAPIPVAQKKKRRPQSGGHIIACRPQGCFPIPYGCHTEVEYDWWDNPTGFDKIVCPRR